MSRWTRSELLLNEVSIIIGRFVSPGGIALAMVPVFPNGTSSRTRKAMRHEFRAGRVKKPGPADSDNRRRVLFLVGAATGSVRGHAYGSPPMLQATGPPPFYSDHPEAGDRVRNAAPFPAESPRRSTRPPADPSTGPSVRRRKNGVRRTRPGSEAASPGHLNYIITDHKGHRRIILNLIT